MFDLGYGKWIKENRSGETRFILEEIQGLGSMAHSLVNNTLVGIGINVADLGVSPTPTLGIAINQKKLAEASCYLLVITKRMECIKVI